MRYCIGWIFMHFQERVFIWRRRRFFHTFVLGLSSLTGDLFMCVHMDRKLTSLIV